MISKKTVNLLKKKQDRIVQQMSAARSKGDTEKIEELGKDFDKLGNQIQELESILEKQEMVEQIINSAMVYVPLAKNLISKRKGEILDLIKYILESMESSLTELQPVLNKLEIRIAEVRFEKFKIYKKAGFTSEQAMNLVLAEVSPGGLLGVLGKNIQNVSSKK